VALVGDGVAVAAQGVVDGVDDGGVVGESEEGHAVLAAADVDAAVVVRGGGGRRRGRLGDQGLDMGAEVRDDQVRCGRSDHDLEGVGVGDVQAFADQGAAVPVGHLALEGVAEGRELLEQRPRRRDVPCGGVLGQVEGDGDLVGDLAVVPGHCGAGARIRRGCDGGVAAAWARSTSPVGIGRVLEQVGAATRGRARSGR
jgi:hypothetical protein